MSAQQSYPTSQRGEQDIDAGAGHRSPGKDEPHRSHDKQDRGGVYVREQAETAREPQRVDRQTMERAMPAPADPDDPAAR